MSGRALDTAIDVETPEGIDLVLRPAGLVARSQATLIDAAIRTAIMLVGAVGSAYAGQLGLGLLLMLFFAVEWLYPVVFELLPRSATPGKRITGLCVVMDTGLPVTPAASFVRNLLRAADFLPFGYALGGLMLLVRSDFKRLGDLAAGTLVVYTTEVKFDGPHPAADPMAPPRALTTTEQAAILAWAGRAHRLTPARWAELAGLAGPLAAPVPGATEVERATRRLLGIAHWVMGRR